MEMTQEDFYKLIEKYKTTGKKNRVTIYKIPLYDNSYINVDRSIDLFGNKVCFQAYIQMDIDMFKEILEEYVENEQ